MCVVFFPITKVRFPGSTLWCGADDTQTKSLRSSLHQRWEGFIGEGTQENKLLFSVRRSSIIGRSSMTVEIYKSGEEYQIEGSFACRNCNILNTEKERVAEIRRKVDATTNVMLGKEVCVLSLRPGFDGAFAMGLVLVLDKIHGGDRVSEDPIFFRTDFLTDFRAQSGTTC
ncbi:hypothetical protein OROMI_026154 [Orobanche minor]